MQKTYDLVIYARGLNAALLLAEASANGLNAALVMENDTRNTVPAKRFGFTMMPQIKKNSYYINSTTTGILKKTASHLIHQSNLMHYKSITWTTKGFVYFSNLFSKNKIRINSKNKQNSIEYSSFKFSTDRLTISLLETARQCGADIYLFSNLISTQYIDNKKYQLTFHEKLNQTDFHLKARSILIESPDLPSKIPTKNLKQTFLNSFSYKAQHQKLNSIVLIDEKNLKITAIPWFDSVYTEIESPEKLTANQAVDLLKKYQSFYGLAPENLHGFSNTEKNLESAHQQYVFHFSGDQSTYQLKKNADDFKPVFKIMKKAGKLMNFSIKESVLNRNIPLPGAQLGIEYHPLRIMEIADEKYDLARQIMKSPLEFKVLFYRYGSGIDAITEKAYDFWNHEKNAQLAWLKAEIWYCIKHEQCQTAESFIYTHTHRWMDNHTNTNHISLIFNEIYKELNLSTP